jgi:hypothetical protein
MHAYIPSKYWSDLGSIEELPGSQDLVQEAKETKVVVVDEEEALERLVSQVQDTRVRAFLPPIVVRLMKQRVLHATDYSTPFTPHPLFTCKHCNQQGKHFQRLCPYIETDVRNQTAELITKVRRIVGIPKSRLRPATPEEIKEGAYYLNENNEKVVVLKKEASESSQQKKRKPQEESEEELTYCLQDVNYNNFWEMLDAEQYESHLEFSFEQFIKTKDVQEAAAEAQFYERHPDLKRKKNQICTHYYRGMCHKGKLECEFLHTGDVNYIAICQFYMNGQCTNGDNCEFRHPSKNWFHNECKAYKAGFCEQGKACKYKHIKYKSPLLNTELHADTADLMCRVLQLK